jgi:hypothetical protein
MRRLAMTWSGDELSRIGGSEELQISTRRPDGPPGTEATLRVDQS